mmetsp:Transcript_10245/g.18120  ORF Transcript_10245/g.18120 Transcript_10245/m.18120 type:complete len:144 (-) Transcript_10245:164-595(-)
MEALEELQKPATGSRRGGWYDSVLLFEFPLSLCFWKPVVDRESPGRFCCFGSDERAFGTGGVGGSMAFCDPNAELSYCYLMNRCFTFVYDDPREFSLRVAAYECANYFLDKSLPLEQLREPHYLTRKWVQRHPIFSPMTPQTN